MGNCNTPTCSIDGKINPENADGTPLNNAVNADRCGERGQRGERRGAVDPGDVSPTPRREVTLGLDPRQPSSTITVEQTRPTDARAAIPAVVRDVAFNGGVPRRDGVAGGGGSVTPVTPVTPVTLARQEGSDVTGYPPVTLARAGKPGEVVTLTPENPASAQVSTPAARTASAPTQAELDAMTPKEREVFRTRAAYAQQQAANPAGAVARQASTADDCYRAFLALPTEVQLRVLTSGTLARYELMQAVVRDAMSGDPQATRVGADWLFGSFQRNSSEVRQFCTAVASLAAHEVLPAGSVVLAGATADRWTRAYGDARSAFAHEFNPAGELALIDSNSALQLFAVLPASYQAAILRGSAFLGDPYALALANALAGPGTIDGVLVSDLLAGHMAPLLFGDPRKVLFQLAVQDAIRGDAIAPAGFIRPAGNPPAPAPAPAPRPPAPRPPKPRPPAAPTPTPAAAPAEFLAASGLTGAQWSQLLSGHPDVAAQLWREFQARPSTFVSVSAAALQAIGVIITGIHQGRVDDLAASNAQYAHQQAMAQLAAGRTASTDSAEIARLQAAANATQQTVQQFQTQQTPQTPQTPPTGITATQVGIGALLLAVIGGGAYLLTRRKHNGRPRRSRKHNGRPRRSHGRARRAARAS